MNKFNIKNNFINKLMKNYKICKIIIINQTYNLALLKISKNKYKIL